MLKRNVLIFHLGALGDFVLTWPLALAVGRLFPQSRVYYVTHAGKGQLAETALRIESADVENGWHELFSAKPNLPEESARLLTGAHAIFTFIAKPADRWSVNVAKINPEAALTHLLPKPPADYAGHATQFLLDQLHIHVAAKAAMEQTLSFIAQRGVALRRVPGADLLVHPGSGSREKCWPPDHFLALIDRIHRSGRRVRLLMGETELERWSGHEIARFTSTAPVLQTPTYWDLLTHLSAAAGFVGNDSGPSHLAGIIAVPTLALFGPSDPLVWKPLGPSVRVMHRQPLAELEVDEVFAEIERLLSPQGP